MAMTPLEHLKQLYEEHDYVEMVLAILTKQALSGETPAKRALATLWGYHDALEREIIAAEAELPWKMLKRVKAGED